MKPPLRTKSVGTKVSEAEFALLEERARGAGLRLAEWVREALLAAPVESGPDAAEVAQGRRRRRRRGGGNRQVAQPCFGRAVANREAPKSLDYPGLPVLASRHRHPTFHERFSP